MRGLDTLYSAPWQRSLLKKSYRKAQSQQEVNSQRISPVRVKRAPERFSVVVVYVVVYVVIQTQHEVQHGPIATSHRPKSRETEMKSH